MRRRSSGRPSCGKDTGFGRFPSRQFAINAAWLELALAAIDLIAWAQVLLLDGELAEAEPKKETAFPLAMSCSHPVAGRR